MQDGTTGARAMNEGQGRLGRTGGPGRKKTRTHYQQNVPGKEKRESRDMAKVSAL